MLDRLSRRIPRKREARPLEGQCRGGGAGVGSASGRGRTLRTDVPRDRVPGAGLRAGQRPLRGGGCGVADPPAVDAQPPWHRPRTSWGALVSTVLTAAAAPAVPVAPQGGVWDLLVVGGGTAGLVGAWTAASLGASVLMVERDRPGGDCLWTGCVPSKALIAAASAVVDARGGARLGVHVAGVRVAFDEVMAHVRSAIATIEPVDSAEALRTAGVAYASVTARFVRPDSAEIGAVCVRFRQALIATGSDPAVPPIPELAEADPLTGDSVWDLAERPDRLVILGGGSIGCELGQSFARLGSTATVIEVLERLMVNEDPDAARLVTESLNRDGARVLTRTPVTAADGADVVLAYGRRLTADRVLVAVGRRSDTRDLGLDAASVATDSRGLVTADAHLRTTNRRIWAARGPHRPSAVHPRRWRAGSTTATNAVLGCAGRPICSFLASPSPTPRWPRSAPAPATPCGPTSTPTSTVRSLRPKPTGSAGWCSTGAAG